MATLGRKWMVCSGRWKGRKRMFKGRTEANIAVVSGIGDSAFEAEYDLRHEAHC